MKSIMLRRIGIATLTLVIGVSLVGFGIGQVSAADVEATSKLDAEINELEEQIDDKEDELGALNKKIETYKGTIREKQLEALSLESQISLLETDINAVLAEVELLYAEIEVIKLEIEKFELRIQKVEEDVQVKKDQLKYYLITTYKNDRTTPLEVVLTQDTFSDFFRQVEYVSNLQGQFQATLDEVQALKKIMERQQSALEGKAAELETQQEELSYKNSQLEGEQNYKEGLLADTESSEAEFQRLVGDAQNQQETANSSILALEREVREKLKEKSGAPEEEEEQVIDLPGEIDFMWPVPSQYITAGFRDSTYPFRRYFEHSAIDIRAGQGTPIKATETGVVGIAKDAGMGYSYIMLVHGSGFSTVYGHVSAIYVTPGQYVRKGDTIGLSGATPGTPGAGLFTTGAHLHFEVRLNGIPVNPVLYLP